MFKKKCFSKSLIILILILFLQPDHNALIQYLHNILFTVYIKKLLPAMEFIINPSAIDVQSHIVFNP